MIVDLRKNRVCVGCKREAKVFTGKWYCGIDYITAYGACKQKKTIHAIPKGKL